MVPICINSFETIPEYFRLVFRYNFDVLKAHNKNQTKEEKMKEKNKECKKISVMVALGIVASTAAFAGPGTMANNNMNNNTMTEVMTIEQVRGLSDNSPVIVRGYLLRQNGENSYIFQDETGTINLEIDQEDWGGMSVSPSDYVEVWGEVDKNGASMIEIDVSAMKKL